MKIAVCDDNKEDLLILKYALETYFKNKGKAKGLKIDCFLLNKDFQKNYIPGKYDLIFFDIYFSNENGFEIVKKMREKDRVSIVFYSSSTDFVTDGYEVDAIGFLLKPLNISKLNNILDKFCKKEIKRKLEIKSRKDYFYFYHEEIMYCESNGRKITIYLSNENDSFTFYGKLDDIEKQLNDSTFLRTHKSYLVNMNYIDTIDSKYFILKNEFKIPIRNKSYSSIVNKYHNYFIGN